MSSHLLGVLEPSVVLQIDEDIFAGLHQAFGSFDGQLTDPERFPTEFFRAD
jgi:hypothetical protein